MTIAYETSASASGSLDTITCNKPSGTVEGDILVAVWSWQTALTDGQMNLPSDWVQLGYRQVSPNPVCKIALKVAGASEPSSYDFTKGVAGATNASCSITRWSMVDNTTPSDVTGSTNTGTSTSPTALSITTVTDGAMIIAAYLYPAAGGSLTIPGDMASAVAITNGVYQGVAYVEKASFGSTGDKVGTIGSTRWGTFLIALRPAGGVANEPPTVVQDTLDEAELTTNPELLFTGTDPDGDTITYRVDIADNTDFGNGTMIVEELTTGGGTPIHPNPVSGTTPDGNRRVDDRVVMGWQSPGGVLDRVEFYFGAHEDYPTHTSGSYLVRIYEAEGYPVDPVPNAWAASTVYTAGQIVRPNSTANANVHFVYRCKTGGTSGSSEPAWPGNGVAWKSVTPLGETNDNTVVWESLPGLYPKNPADPADTPTRNWIAISDSYPYSPGVVDAGWKQIDFSGAQRIRLTAGAWYMALLDWLPNDYTTTNSIVVWNASLGNATSPGNVYLDGSDASGNNGPRIIEDSWFKIHEVLVGNTYLSTSGSYFENLDTPSDNDPFISGDQIKFTSPTVSVGKWYWRVSGKDPDGTNTSGSYSPIRSFTSGSSSGSSVTVEPSAVFAVSLSTPPSVFDTAQFSGPDLDISNSGWLNESSGSSNLYASIDEAYPPNDTDYIYTSGSGSVISLSLAPMVNPGTSSAHVIRVRIKKPVSESLKVELYSGVTKIKEVIITEVYADFATVYINVSEAEAATISDYSDLSIVLTT